jgi:hypothetical protein
MEYIHGLDMRNYLIHNNIDSLVHFILDILNRFSKNSIQKDYTKAYYKKLEWMDFDDSLPFSKDELIDKLPKIFPYSTYHGDLTLENIIHTDSGFYMIDAVTTEYDSYIFDIAKMRQDLECKWFLRENPVKIDTKLQNIQEEIKKVYPQAFDDSLLILMLLRVYCHTNYNDTNYHFIKNNINRLWKNRELK